MKKDSNIDNLLELVKKVNSDLISSEKPVINLMQSRELFEEFEYLHENIYNHKNFSLDTNNRLESILHILANMANMDFSGIAEVKDNFDHLDYFAFSLNHTSDRIREQVDFLQIFKHLLNAYRDAHIITDSKGVIIHANEVLRNLFEIEDSLYRGIQIKDFFNSFPIKTKYSLEFVNSCGNHGIVSGYNENKIASTVLRISSRQILNDDHESLGYCYKIERMNHDIYRQNESSETIKLVESIYDQNTPDSDLEKREVLLSISRKYSLKTELNFREILILNSVNEQLDELENP